MKNISHCTAEICISLAESHASKGGAWHDASALECLEDARACLAREGEQGFAAMWAARSLGYSVGVYHPDYRRARMLAGRQ